MKFSVSSKTKSKAKNTILFVCVENAGRSQMAEAFFRKYAPDIYEAISAGTKHTSEINPLAVKAMNQKGIDINKQKPKEITEDMIKNATKIINMGCTDKNFCPALFVPKVVDWGIEDPKGKPIEKVAEIRDEIEQRVRELIDGLNQDNKQDE
ncbi:MAG: arsenate reductase ArsC [Candidatus Nitrosocosmicus sp.]